MANDYYIKGNKTEILQHMLTGPDPTSRAHEQMKMAIFVRCTEDLERVIKDFTDSSNKLSNRILWLNNIFGAFTVIGAVFTIWQIFR